MTNEELVKAVRILQDRQAILDCLTAYSRGVDRLDRELVLSAYHPDAIDDRGIFRGGPEAFWEWAYGVNTANFNINQHIITNHSCELDGDVAHAETYWMVVFMSKEDPPLMIQGGRYVDRMERRNGRWAIAVRKVVREWRGVPGEGPAWARQAYKGPMKFPPRDRTDISYQRPLTVE